jgi:hypothetical protein
MKKKFLTGTEKKFEPSDKELKYFLHKSEILVGDSGSEIEILDPEKTFSRSRGEKGTGSRIRIRNTG